MQFSVCSYKKFLANVRSTPPLPVLYLKLGMLHLLKLLKTLLDWLQRRNGAFNVVYALNAKSFEQCSSHKSFRALRFST